LHYREAITDNLVTVPNACLTDRKFSFSVYGINNEDVRVTTNRVLIHLQDSNYTTNVENDIDDDEPTIVEQIYIDMNNMKDELEESIEKKADADDLSTVAVTGEYADLENIPTTFPPETHTHKEADITDLKSYVQTDDIVDDLNSRDSDKVLSAKQGNRLN
jgi:hypothetical protein